MQITDGLYAIRCVTVNFYALRTGVGVVLFDTGMNPATAIRGLGKLGISPDSVTHIFLTHTDYDHTGGLPAFPECERYISSAEEQMINGQTARRGSKHNKGFGSYHIVEDNETVTVGDTDIQAFIKPGHTPGSAVYLIDKRYIACGDLLRVSRKGALLPFLRLMNMNHRQNIKSMEEMWAIVESSDYVLTGHTGVYRMSTRRDEGNC